MKLDYSTITAKSVEVSKCFTTQRGMHQVNLENTLRIGNIARLAANIRQTEILNEKQLGVYGLVLKEDFPIIKRDYIPVLEKLGWIETEMRGSKINKIQESIPPVRQILHQLGIFWEESEPSEIDRATLYSLTLLKDKPFLKEALESEISSKIDIRKDDLEIMLGHGLDGSYLGTFESYGTGGDVIWTPYYWTRNSEKVSKFLKGHSEDNYSKISNLNSVINEYPGIPIEKVDQKLLISGIKSGFFPTNQITIPDQDFTYIFPPTPQFGLEPKNDIFEKARIIVSAVRHGQHHAEVTRIRNPYYILRALRERGLKPHSHALKQYGMLIQSRICGYEKVDNFGGSYEIYFIDTPENNKAMDLAEMMVGGEDPEPGVLHEPELKELIGGSSSFEYGPQSRQNISSDFSSEKSYNDMMECISGSRLRE